MRSGRWSFVPTALGSVLLASAAADGHELVMLGREDDWQLFARLEVGFLVGLWLLAGLAPQWARITALTAFTGILAYDVMRATAGFPTRPGFARVAVGPWCTMIGDLLVLLAFSRWRLASDQAARIEAHPGRWAGTAMIAAALGIAADGSQIGRFPMAARARSGGASSPRQS